MPSNIANETIPGLMVLHEVQAKSVLRKHDRIDSWFISHYGMNLYRGCAHNCAYCDGRSEKYNVSGDFGEDVDVKVNAIEVLRKELDPCRKTKPLKRGFIMIGGGVGDSYQPVEKDYKLARNALQLMYERNIPVHILTKSTLVSRDADILKKINQRSKAIVSFSLSSSDEISTLFEPNVPSPAQRLESLRTFKHQGLNCGIFLMPVIPFVTDTPDAIENTVRRAKDSGADFIIFGGMTLKEGRQKDYFFMTLKERFPELVEQYNLIYPGNRWGSATSEYYSLINKRFYGIAKKHKIPIRVPPFLYRDILSKNDLVIVVLDQIDYLLKLEGKTSAFGAVVKSISHIETPLDNMIDGLSSIKGMDIETERATKELLKTGRCAYHENLLSYT